MAPLLAQDGHDEFPACLGEVHLREGLSDDQCMNCSFTPHGLKVTRLAEVEGPQVEGELPPPRREPMVRVRSPPRAAPPRKKARKADGYAAKVDKLVSEFAEIKSLLFNLHTVRLASTQGSIPQVEAPTTPEWDGDALSTRASCSQLYEDRQGQCEVEASIQASEDGSQHVGSGSRAGSEASPAMVKPVVRLALARLGLDAAPAAIAPASAFFRRVPPQDIISVPPSQPYIEELQRCWPDRRSLSHHTSDSRALASMQNASKHGLDRMPAVEPTIASLIVAPEEVLRPNAHCPRPQCRITDDLLTRCYDTAARMGRIGNSLSHLILALSQSLQTSSADTSAQSLSDTSLQALAFMTRELGRLMSTLKMARRQVWLAQSQFSEPCQRTLRTLPVVPGELFGPAAQQALNRGLQANQTRQQFASLRGATSLSRQQPPQGYGTNRPLPPEDVGAGSDSSGPGTQQVPLDLP
ncbi:unnamed protein product [Boreogadus saida]